MARVPPGLISHPPGSTFFIHVLYTLLVSDTALSEFVFTEILLLCSEHKTSFVCLSILGEESLLCGSV